MASFAVRRYTEAHATVMAREWCAKMEYLFGIWMGQESWEYVFTDEELQAYTPREEFLAFFLGLDLEGETIARASAMNIMKPGIPRLAVFA